MNKKIYLCIFQIVLIATCAFALKPDEILIITNDKNPASLRIAEHYCKSRNVPTENILQLSLDASLDDTISRVKYNDQIAAPILDKLSQSPFDKNIKCLLTTYGVPFRVGPRTVVPGTEPLLADLTGLADDHAQIIRGTLTQLATLGQSPDTESNITAATSHSILLAAARKEVNTTLTDINRLLDPDQQKQQLQLYVKYFQQLFGIGAVYNKSKEFPSLQYELTTSDQIEYNEKARDYTTSVKNLSTPQQRFEQKFYALAQQVIGFGGSLELLDRDIKILKGSETSASVDSELSMIKFGDYELYRYQPNELKERTFWFGVKTLMVSRLDGPSETIAMNLVDKAIAAERIPLQGNAYFDSGKPGDGEYKLFNGYIRDAAAYFQKNTTLNVLEETTPGLFQPTQCPATAIYCGWYSLENYIDAFDFVNGAIGYHVASFEAIDLRDPDSNQWCPSMLKDGITATLGPVDEPYLQTFPKPDEFFIQIVKGKPLVEAYYKTKPFNSWQMMLIGDPLYSPKIPGKP